MNLANVPSIMFAGVSELQYWSIAEFTLPEVLAIRQNALDWPTFHFIVCKELLIQRPDSESSIPVPHYNASDVSGADVLTGQLQLVSI